MKKNLVLALVFLSLFLISPLLNSQVSIIDTSSEIQDKTDYLEYRGIKIIPYLTNTTQVDGRDMSWVVNQTTKSFYPILSGIDLTKNPLTEFHYNISALETGNTFKEEVNQFLANNFKEELSFNTFLNKNQIDKFYIEEHKNKNGDIIGYTANFYGIIFNTDPEWVYSFVSSSSDFVFNRTRANHLGVGLVFIGNATQGYNYTSGDVTSHTFYNYSTTIFNYSFGIADSNGSSDVYDYCMADADCVSYWSLDDSFGAGNVYNDQKGANEGVPNGTTNSTGISSKAINFNTRESYINFTSNMYHNISVAYWAKNSSQNEWHFYVIAGDKYYIDGDSSSSVNLPQAVYLNRTWSKFYNPSYSGSSGGGSQGIIAEGTTGTGDYRGVTPGSVVKNATTYMLWYHGGNSGSTGYDHKIFLATSINGLNWIKYNNTIRAENDTIGTYGGLTDGTAGTGDYMVVKDPAVIFNNSIYQMWYAGGNYTQTMIFYANSTDGYNWTKYNNTAPAKNDTIGVNGGIPLGVKRTGVGDWFNIQPSSVILDEDGYKMWYLGSNQTLNAIYYATSPDGITWTKYNNSVPADNDTYGINGGLPRGTAGQGDRSIGTPRVIKINSTYYMFYNGYGVNWAMFSAISSDGLNWTKVDNSLNINSSDIYGGNMRMPQGNIGKGDEEYATVGASIYEEGILKMWYHGYSGISAYVQGRVFYATMPMDYSFIQPSFNRMTSNLTMDEVLLFNKTLNPQEVNEIYYAGLSQHADANITVQTRTGTDYNLADAGLVSFWGLNNETLLGEDGTFFADLAPNNKNNGSCITCPSFTKSGYVDGGMIFDGTNDYINATTYDISNHSGTIAMWIKADDTDSQRTLANMRVNATNEFRLTLLTDNLYFDIGQKQMSTSYNDEVNWHFVAGTWDYENNNSYLYVDRTQEQVTDYTQKFSVTNSIQFANNFSSTWFDGTMDEIRIYNRSLNETEIENLYELGSYHITGWTAWTDEKKLADNQIETSNTSGKFFQFKTNFYTNNTISSPYLINYSISQESGEPLEFSSISLTFRNNSNSAKTIFNEGEDFKTYISWTDQDSQPINYTYGSCNLTFINGLDESFIANSTNFSLCGTGCQYSTRTGNTSFTQIYNSHTGNVTDFAHFYACHNELAQGDMIVNISCSDKSYTETILAGELSLCSMGYSLILTEHTGACQNSSQVNVSLTYAGINNRRKTIYDLAIDREYEYHTIGYPSSIYYNQTSSLWETNSTHEYYSNGAKTIMSNCTYTADGDRNGTTTATITIVNKAPVIFFERVNNAGGAIDIINYINLTYYAGQWNWSIAVEDDDIDKINYLILNASNYPMLNVTSTTSIIVNTTDGFFDNLENPYKFFVTANDTAGNITIANINFSVLDATSPAIILNTPVNNTYSNITSINFTANLSDDIELKNATLWIYWTNGSLFNSTSAIFSSITEKIIGIVVNMVDGVFNWFYESYDTSGNKNVSDNRTITIDTINPAISFVLPTPSQNLTQNRFQTNISIQEANLENLTYDFNGELNTFSAFKGLIGLYNFDNQTGENETFVKDWSSHSNNGSVFGASLNQTGKYGSGFSFKGTGEYITLGNLSPISTSPTGSHSIAFWAKPAYSTSDENSVVVFKGEAYADLGGDFRCALGISSPGTKISVSSYILPNGFGEDWQPSYGWSSSATKDTSIFHHVACVYNGFNLSVYLDGVLLNESDVSDGITDAGNTNPYLIGRQGLGESWVDPANGTIDELMIFNTELIGTDVAFLYNSSIHRYNSGTDNSWNIIFNHSGVSDGDYFFIANVTDSVNHFNSTARYLSIDSTAPTITSYNPLSSSYQDLVFLLNFSCSDSHPINKEWYDWNKINNTYTTDIELFSTSGNKTMRIYCNDSFGNQASSFIPFRVLSIPANQACLDGFRQIGFYDNGTIRCEKITSNNITLLIIPLRKEFYKDENINLQTICVSTNGTFCNENQSCRISISYPNATLINNRTIMNYSNGGIFNYSLGLTNGTNNLPGEYSGVVDCHSTFLQASSFNFKVLSSNLIETDSSPPIILISSPQSMNYLVTNISFGITSNENLSKCVITLDNYTSNTSLSIINNQGSTSASIVKNLSIGGYNAKFWCNDTSGNIRTNDVNFTIQEYVSTSTTTPSGSSGGGGGSYAYKGNTNKTNQICSKVYYFMINHINSNGSLKYTDLEVSTLANNIEREISTAFLSADALSYINNYKSICENLTGLILPEKKKTIGFLNMLNPNDENYCDLEINKTILFWDMDQGYNFEEANLLNENDCETINSKRLWFKLKKIGENYYVTGVKLWYVYFLSLFALLIMITIFIVDKRFKKHALKLIKNG